MALGQMTRGVSLLKLTEAFSSFGADGVLRPATTYIKVVDIDGNPVLENSNDGRRVFKESTARIMNQLLKNVTASGTARQLTLDGSIEVAGKTGTSSGNLDKLFVGYTPYMAAGIWCGYDKADRGVYALSKNHIEIWDEVMGDVHSAILNSDEQVKSFSTGGLLYRPYCMDSGQIYSDSCKLDVRGDRKEWGYFTEDNLPRGLCECHVICDYDWVSKGIADKTCPESNKIKIALLKISGRNFPKEIVIADAEYEYRQEDNVKRPEDREKPYFYYLLPDNVYTGIKAGTTPFNRAGKRYNQKSKQK